MKISKIHTLTILAYTVTAHPGLAENCPDLKGQFVRRSIEEPYLDHTGRLRFRPQTIQIAHTGCRSIVLRTGSADGSATDWVSGTFEIGVPVVELREHPRSKPEFILKAETLVTFRDGGLQIDHVKSRKRGDGPFQVEHRSRQILRKDETENLHQALTLTDESKETKQLNRTFYAVPSANVGVCTGVDSGKVYKLFRSGEVNDGPRITTPAGEELSASLTYDDQGNVAFRSIDDKLEIHTIDLCQQEESSDHATCQASVKLTPRKESRDEHFYCQWKVF